MPVFNLTFAVMPAAVAGRGYQLDRHDVAQPCPPGNAKAKAGNAPCAKCPGRTYQPSKKQLSCRACPSGRRVNAARTACIAYGPGVQPGRLNAPEKCPPGDSRSEQPAWNSQHSVT